MKLDPEKITEEAPPLDLNIDFFFVLDDTLYKKGIEDAEVEIPGNSIVIVPAAQGGFGLEIEFTFSIDELEILGLTAENVKMYHVNSLGNVVEVRQLLYGTDGSVTVRITHASYYVLTKEAPVRASSIIAAPEPPPETENPPPEENGQQSSDGNNGSSPSDTAIADIINDESIWNGPGVLIAIAVAIVSILALIFIKSRR